MYILTYMYMLHVAEISAYHLPFAIEMYRRPFFFPGHPYIESTTVLSDILYIILLYIKKKYIYIYVYIN